jgi:5-methylcytosine-specific restriction protein A
MPRKPKRPCSFPGCPELTDGRYCDKHQKQVDAYYNKYERDPQTRKRYDRRWRRIRDRYISEHPLCEECQKYGRLTPAEEVHHIIPLSKGGTNADSNLMSLCKQMSLIDHCPRRRAVGKTVGGSKSPVEHVSCNGRGVTREKSQFQTGYIPCLFLHESR